MSDNNSVYGLDGSDRQTVESGELTFEVGPLPFGKGEELIAAWTKAESAKWLYLQRAHPGWWASFIEAGKTNPTAEMAFPDDPGIQAAQDAAYYERIQAALEIVRWTAKSWRVADKQIAPLRLEATSFAGQTYEVVNRPQLAAFARASGGGALLALASRIVAAEQLSAREALGFT